MRILGEKHMRAILLARFLVGSLLFLSSLTFAAEPLLLEDLRLVPNDSSPPGFGSSVAIDGDVAVVGATTGGGSPETGKPGAAYVFERQSNGTWQQVAKLLPLYEEPDGIGSSNFGTSVAIEGNVIVVGCYFSAQTTVFERINGVWTRTAVFDDAEGAQLAIKDGTIILAHTHGAYLYRRGATGWARMQTLVNGLPLQDADYMGPAVGISSVAAFHGDYGNEDDIDPPAPSTLYIYPLGANHLWTGAPAQVIPDPSGLQYPSSFAGSIHAYGTTAVVSGYPLSYIFERNAQGVWNISQTLEGAGLIDGNTIIAGPSTGVRVYRRTSSGWAFKASVASSTAGGLGAMALKGNQLIAGGDYYYPGPSGIGAYVFTLPEQLASNPPMVQDDFEDGNANGWVAQPNSTFGVASIRGSWMYRQTNITTGAASIYQSADWDRQSIQADVTPRSYAAPPGDRWFGLMVRYIDANNYYYITARSSNTIELKRMVNGVFTTLGSAPLSVALNRNYGLRLEAHGEHLRVFVDGRQVINAFDGALTRGRPGITMYRTRADYDNVILNPDPSIQLMDERFNASNIVWDYVDYNYQWVTLANQNVFSSPTTGGGAYGISGTTGSDQIIRARMRATQFNGADRWFGLIGRYVDAQNYYYVTLRNSNQISLKKLTNGAITMLDNAVISATTPVTVNTWYDLRLDIVGTKLRVYLNGLLMLEATDNTSPHVAGRTGVGAYKTAAQADDFLVVQP